MSNEFAVIDFETTGLGADCCRVIEVAAVIVRDGEVADSFVQLMHPGCRLPYFITDLTGITDEMLRGKPSPET
ncbi:MAG: 3'-5' exonuclease, partial [Victivallales bacterium]